MNFCIYRNINTSTCCCFKAKTKNNYCNIHINNKNIVYEIIYNAIGTKQIKTDKQIYKIFEYIYNNPMIYTKELIFNKIIDTIFINNAYIKLIYPYLKDLNINNIFKLNMNTYQINKELEKDNYKALKVIKNSFYSFIIKPHKYNPDINYINSNDPFTFDDINDIPMKHRFIFSDDNDNYYCFKANEFKYFISTNGNWNPYTKHEINPRIIRNLFIYINYYNLETNYNNEWTTVNQAYTDVSQSIEKIGFYTNTEWFLKLTSKQIKNIIRLFKIISQNISNDYFTNLLNDETSIFFDFAKETIRLFENGNSSFLLCCNYMKALGIYSTDFYNSLPEWISDIETPIIIDNHNRNYEIVYLINVIDG
jgi:hypothetical protein